MSVGRVLGTNETILSCNCKKQAIIFIHSIKPGFNRILCCESLIRVMQISVDLVMLIPCTTRKNTVVDIDSEIPKQFHINVRSIYGKTFAIR